MKPIGIKLISIFSFIIGIFGVLSGLIILTLSPQLLTLLSEQDTGTTAEDYKKALTEYGVFLGIAPIILGGITLVGGYGLYRIYKWSWVFQIVISVLYIYTWIPPTDVDMALSIFFIISYSLIILYLCRGSIRSYFHSISYRHIVLTN